MLSQPLPPLVPSSFVHIEDDAAWALDFDLAEDFWRDWVTAMAGWTWNAPLVLA